MLYHFINYGVNTITVSFSSGSCLVKINNSCESMGTVSDGCNVIRRFLAENKQFLTKDKVINIRLMADNYGKDTLQISSDMSVMMNHLRMMASSYDCQFNIHSGFNRIG